MDTINSVQFSNHTGYKAGVRGQVLDDTQLQVRLNMFLMILNMFIMILNMFLMILTLSFRS